MKTVRTISATLVIAFAMASTDLTSTAGAVEMRAVPETSLLTRVDWQAPEQLPRQFRNHCTAENFTGRPYCSNHCGIDYQFFYCSQASFGCCHLGHGYCDWDGHLRCSP
jgi:hypothetical protein